jgi:hypothetical protein
MDSARAICVSFEFPMQFLHILIGMRIGTLIGIKNRRPFLLILGAWLLNGAAWFLPVVKSVGGGEIDPITGWQAFVMASSSTWNGDISSWFNLLATVSAVTAIFFFALPWVVLRGSRSLQRASSWVAAVAFVFNAHWYIRLHPNGWISDLGVGYFLWWWSFVPLAIGLFDLGGGKNSAEPTQSQAALLPR